MMDVSGSMTDEQKEIVRIESFWIDTWIKRHYKGVDTVYIIHDAVAQEVDEHTLLPHPRERRDEDQLGLRTVQQDHRRPLPAEPVERLRLPLLGRRQLGRRRAQVHRPVDRATAAEAQPVRLRAGGIAVRQRRVLRTRPRAGRTTTRTWSSAAIPDRDAILGSIKEFLKTGR